MRKALAFLEGVLCALLLPLFAVQAQTNSYKQTNLVSDTAGLAPVMDSDLVNPWGICIVPGDPFWISDNNSSAGVTTLYTKNGMQQGSFTVAPPRGSSNPATPTGCVGNSLGGFIAGGASSQFIFDTEDGTISAWSGGASTSLAVDNSAAGAVYKGLALLSNPQGNFLLATNFRSGMIEVYDTNFHQTNVSGTFTDPNEPAVPQGSGSPGYAPFGVHVATLNNTPRIIVTYALQNALKHDPMNVAGSGFVDLYDENGSFVRRLAEGSHMNSPWGAVIPPSSFGVFAGKLLVGNFGDGTINAFDLNTGAFIDQMKDSNGSVIVNPSLWDMVFDPSGQTGDPKTMYITSGLNSEMHGLFAAITSNAVQPTATPDFSISATPPSQTISAGQPAQFTVTVGSLNAFNSAVSLACSGQPAGSTCSFGQSSVTPASGGTAMTTMTIMTSSNPYAPAVAMAKRSGGAMFTAFIPMVTLAAFSIFILRAPRNRPHRGRRALQYFAASFGIAVATAFLLAANGCGYSSKGTGTQRGVTTVMITGTSGNLSHSTSVSLTVQ